MQKYDAFKYKKCVTKTAQEKPEVNALIIQTNNAKMRLQKMRRKNRN